MSLPDVAGHPQANPRLAYVPQPGETVQVTVRCPACGTDTTLGGRYNKNGGGGTEYAEPDCCPPCE